MIRLGSAVLLALALLAGLILIPLGIVRAATFDVGCGASRADDLIDAINGANNNGQADTINLTAGCAYTLTFVDNSDATGSNGLPRIVSPITINGNGATILRDPTTPFDFRLFFVTAAGQLTLSEVTVRSGREKSAAGGGLYNAGQLVVVDSVIRQNSLIALPAGDPLQGGGIYNSGTLILSNSLVASNTVLNTVNATGEVFGGGLYNSGQVTITHSEIRHNEAQSVGTATGGGLYNSGQLWLEESLVSTNTADSLGGGMATAGSAASVVLSQATFGYNTTGGDGGAIYYAGSDGTMQITKTILSYNEAGGDGGAIYYAATGGTTQITNTTLSGNQAGSDGGGLVVADGTVSLNYTTIATNSGGGVYRSGGTLKLHNTLVGDNSPVDCSGVISSLGYNLVEDATGCTIGGVITGNITGQDPQLEPLSDDTHALGYNSPALNGGDPAACIATDQRGVTRPYGDRCDIGAYEVRLGLSLSKTVDNSLVRPGDTVTYTVTVINNSDIKLSDATISDTLPPDLSFIGPVTLEQATGTTTITPTALPLLVSGVSIPVGGQIEASYPVQVSSGIGDGLTLLTNTAAVTTWQITTPAENSQQITVAGDNCPLDPSITFEPINPEADETINFVGGIAGGTGPITFTWNFGDSTAQLLGQFRQYAYWREGYYTVLLTVTGQGCPRSALAQTTIQVGDGVSDYYTFLPLLNRTISSTTVTAAQPERRDQPPGQPRGLGGRVEGETIHLSWQPGEGAISGYRLYRRPRAGDAAFRPAATLPPNRTDYPAACGYIYLVTAYNAAGESPPGPASYYSPACR